VVTVSSVKTQYTNDLAAALYRRFVTLVDATRDPLSGDRRRQRVARRGRRDYDQLDFTYDNPTIATILTPPRGGADPQPRADQGRESLIGTSGCGRGWVRRMVGPSAEPD
jgi:hypothetical protein